jgi:8-oxo-dGTP pyrophosphatase MutT (NUDIX family)
VLVLNRHAELLLCHATGAAHWDIPKGVGDPGESPRDAALRETDEETGLRLDPGALLDLGRRAYRPDKDLHLFACLIDRVDPKALVCRSRFVDRRGHEQPEADAFEWTPFERVGERCAKRMAALLTREMSLPELLGRLGG